MNVEFYLLHRTPPAASWGHVDAYLEKGAAALAAGFDGLVLQDGVDLSETPFADALALVVRLSSQARAGRFAICDLALAVHSVPEIQRRAALLAALGPGRVELGISLGRPRDLWAANVSAATARMQFRTKLEVLLWALGLLDNCKSASALPEFRSLLPWPSELNPVDLFVSGTYCEENRLAITSNELSWLSYGDVMDDYLSVHTPKGRAQVVKVDLVGVTSNAAEHANAVDPRLFSARGAPPGYYSAEEYRLRLVAPAPAILAGSPSDVAAALRALTATCGARRIVIDPCLDGQPAEAVQANLAAAITELLPAMRTEAEGHR